MLDFVFRPLRSALGVAEQEIERPIVESEREILDAVKAIREATESLERHVAVIEVLATSVRPLTDSVTELTSTMDSLVTMMAPMQQAEQEAQRVGHFFDRFRHKPEPGPGGISTSGEAAVAPPSPPEVDRPEG
jgi:hypothetical protein